jgi:ParB family chromosome partitioning protein
MAKKDSGLGRGFYDIMDDNMLEYKKGCAEMVRISDIEPRRDQPRKTFEREALQALADSIAVYGVLQPIIVRENADFEGTYEIIAGERRWRAAKMAGLSEIPAVVFDGDELKAAQVALIENIQREDLNPVEEAMGYGALIDRFGLTQEQVAKQVGKSRSAITNCLRLLELPDEVLELLKRGELSAGHARALLGLDNEDQMAPLAQKIVEKGLSVRDVERTVRLMNYTPSEVDTVEQNEAKQRKAYMHDLEHRAVSVLGRRVRILKTAKKKVVELAYSDDDDLAELLKSICGGDFFADND